MTRQNPDLPHRVFPKGRWYYLVTAQGTRRVWTKLTLIQDGLPALYRKLADLAADDVAPDRMPALIAAWQDEVQPAHSAKTREGDERVMRAIAEAFAEFRASQVSTPDCVEFLKDYRDRPRTHNLMRTGLQALMRLAELKGFRPAGSNPVTAIAQMKTPPRDRYPSDSEVRRIKYHAMVGRDGLRTRSGPMLAGLIDLAYLTGQRVGDLLELRRHRLAALGKDGKLCAPYIAKDGLHFKPSKTENTTGAKVLIRWTPKLRAAVERIKALKPGNPVYVFANQEGQQLLYSTFATAWWRACDRAGIKGLHFHDLRAKALTDTKRRRGIAAAQIMGTHSTEGQTSDYVREHEAQETEATR